MSNGTSEEGLDLTSIGYPIPLPFPAVDAYVFELVTPLTTIPFITRRQFRLRRTTLTAGSARYFLDAVSAGNHANLFSILIRMVDSELSYLSIDLPAGGTPYSTETLFEFARWLIESMFKDRNSIHEHKSTASGSTKEQGATLLYLTPEALLTPRKQGSHQNWPEDNWAWEQVNTLGRPRNEVRSEWIQRLSPKRKTLRDANDSFRKAVSSHRKPKTESG